MVVSWRRGTPKPSSILQKIFPYKLSICGGTTIYGNIQKPSLYPIKSPIYPMVLPQSHDISIYGSLNIEILIGC